MWERRYTLCDLYAELRRHKRILEYLGPEGMSSDESDYETGEVQYYVYRKPWRAEIVTTFLRVLDKLHFYRRFKAAPSSFRGSPPRTRIFTNLISTTQNFVANLPINAYEVKWFRTLSPVVAKNIVAPNPQPYDFAHDDAILQ